MQFSLHYMVLIVVIIETISICCKILPNSSTTIDTCRLEYRILPKLDYISREKEIGILHTLSKYGQWHIKEENLIKYLGIRVKLLYIQHKFFKRFYRRSEGKFRAQIQCPSKCLNLIRKVLKYKIRSIFTDLDLLGNQISHNKWIGNEDLLISMTGILHLQNVYLVPASQMSIGLTFDSKFGGFLSQLEILLQALFCFRKNGYVTAIDWLQEATLLKKNTISSQLVRSILFILIQTHNFKYATRSSATEQLSNTRSDDIDDLYQLPILNGRLPSEQISNRMFYFHKHRSIDSNIKFTDLCNGISLQSTKLQSTLHCFIDNRKHPYLYINPMKVEQLYINPLILQFYEIMSNKTMQEIVREVGPHVTTLNLWFDDKNFAYGSVPVGVTNSARMGFNFGNVSKTTQKLTSIMSGLTVWDGPNHNRYGEHVYGRHFNLHNDGLQSTPLNAIPEDNDIMATMVFYLRLPRLGGCTAFVHAGVCSREVPGSAVFWYNMHTNGSYTTELKHGSCPVYHGEKIAISLFLKHNANWNKRLCSLDQFK